MRKPDSTEEVSGRPRLYSRSTAAPTAVRPEAPHQLEQAIQRYLLSRSDLRFSSLVIRRIAGGVCLEGVVESEADLRSICRLAGEVAGVKQVLNRLVVQRHPPRHG